MRISIISIALAVIVNLITIAVVTGFQQEVRQKISGFGAHIFIQSAGENSIYESEPVRKDQTFIDSFNKDKSIESIFGVGYKPVLFQSEKKARTYKLSDGRDTSETNQQIYGAILKGVPENYNWQFFKTHLIKGKIPQYIDSIKSDLIVISDKIAKDLHYKIDDTVSAFFVKNQPVKRNFIICGIYDTGLEEFDKKIVVADLKRVQELNDWGIKSSIQLADSLHDGQLIIKADISGGNGNYKYDWGKGFETYSGFTLCPIKDTVVRLIATDYWSSVTEEDDLSKIPDTAFLKIKIEGEAYSPCDFEMDEFGEVKKTYLNSEGTAYYIQTKLKKVRFELTEGKGSANDYVGGFEIILKNWNELDDVVRRVRKKIDFIPTSHYEMLKTTSIKDNQKDIFVWLGFLDINVFIILGLMILIGIINMGSALLVLILIRANFIGMLKSMGATNWSIRKIFLIQATFLISRGMIWGNAIGIGICMIQKYFGVFTLNPEVYYLSKVPISIDLMQWVALNIGTLIICIVSLIIPSIVITRIKPVKAIKFN